MTAAEIVKALGGHNGMARCPAHNDRTPSLSVSTGRDGRLLVHCHAGCPNPIVWDALRQRGLISPDGEFSCQRENSPLNAAVSDRLTEARTIWEETRPALHIPAHRYLLARGITIPSPPCVRYHEDINALVAGLQRSDGTFAGVQRIYLAGEADRIHHKGKRSLGPIKGAAVRLTPVAESMQLCESVEDGLALLQMTGRPTWAVPGVSFMANYEPPREVRKIVLAPDHDKAGLAAIERVKSRLTASKPCCLLPPAGSDWCDVLQDYDERLAIGDELKPERSWIEEFVNG